jgi:hypothetical protein
MSHTSFRVMEMSLDDRAGCIRYDWPVAEIVHCGKRLESDTIWSFNLLRKLSSAIVFPFTLLLRERGGISLITHRITMDGIASPVTTKTRTASVLHSGKLPDYQSKLGRKKRSIYFSVQVRSLKSFKPKMVGSGLEKDLIKAICLLKCAPNLSSTKPEYY